MHLYTEVETEILRFDIWNDRNVAHRQMERQTDSIWTVGETEILHLDRRRQKNIAFGQLERNVAFTQTQR